MELIQLGRRTRVVKSAVVYEGPSLLDMSSEIVVVVTGLGKPSSNSKTGSMVQTYILRRDRHPSEAIKDGSDAAICGDCPLRLEGSERRVCYVRQDGPASVWRAYQRGSYPNLSPYDVAQLVRDRPVRLGTYGDPRAVPPAIWAALVGDARTTGYTHQWRTTTPAAYPWLMASADSAEDAAHAQAAGWRTFRVRRASEPLLAREVACPASHEMGQRVTCEQCRLCDGRIKAKNIAIIAHGPGGSAF